MISRSRSVPVLALCVLATAALLGVLPATAAKVTRVKSNVTIASGEATEFTGKVTSADKRCRVGRTVKLFREIGGPDKLVGTDRTSSSGRWEIHGSFLAAKYHAEVARMTFHTGSGTIECRFDLSVSARF